MAKRIALFNHKGGVSKTTTTFNLGWMLASKGKRVILADTDPQCNLTEIVLGYKGPTEFERFYETEKERNLGFGLAPAFESWPSRIKPVDCIPIEGQEGLFLLPGHILLSEYEVALRIAQEFSGSIQTLRNLPGSISCILEKTANKFNTDYVLIDMNPGFCSFNQNLLMTSHFFIVPATPDYFSVMAMDSLSKVLLNWHAWAEQAHSLHTLKKSAYPFPDITPKFLGTIIQNYLTRGEILSPRFQKWISEINKSVSDKLVPELDKLDMMLPKQIYKEQGVEWGFCLAIIPDFNTLIANSQKFQTPIFALTPEQLEQIGVGLENIIKSRDNFKKIFSELADKVIGLTNYANSD
jgi:cellulose biosynthesis protein BcsQ